MKTNFELRTCFRDPIPKIYESARLLNDAVTAHLNGNIKHAEKLIRNADMPIIREWTESIWGAKSTYVIHREIPNISPFIPKELRTARMPNSIEKRKLESRDGFHCRFCGIPVIRQEIRVAIFKIYPNALRWGSKNTEQHAGFQAMWLQYDHLLPHARGGNNDLENIVITCAPCNYGRTDSLIEEVGLLNPLDREPIKSGWDGLERFLL